MYDWFHLSKCYILISEPGCLELEGTVHGIVGVHGTGELGERVAIRIQRLDGHIDFLIVRGQEEVADRT